MKKTAGFLLVLLLAIMTIITISIGDETDSSHLVHLEAAYGPQITCNTSCHSVDGNDDFVGFLDSSPDLANTTVCDTCHSPGGVYDGVDDPDIGAKTNWDTGVFNGGELAAGKEKWCLGCHDDDPAVINGVSSPNIAGDDTSYGFYKTGHGKHGNEQAITCLACHDPALTHVDGEPRTYAAASDNYQAGHRLKSVNGEAPLEVPRSSGTVINEDQFRLCFSCHYSAPFMTRSNTDTNFRADVDDSCNPLNPFVKNDKVNKHNLHLNYKSFLIYDSDWDGEPADSLLSCPACHNVHGPRLMDGPEITHAPGMIRTGELIGRESEGALDLDYFVNPCPDTTLSPTNELFDDTGDSTGAKIQSTGNRGDNMSGVCVMCHSANEEYWRDARDILSCASGNCHTAGSHATHLADDNGPHIACGDCHNTSDLPLFSDNEDLANTDVCDPCHSPGGTYDGVNAVTVGAKDNWEAGVYDENMALQPGKEKWCAGCHDEEPSIIDGISAPNIVGDEDGSYTYGTGWGYYKTGHGLTASAAYPSKGGLIEPPLINGAARPVECDACHDFSTAHIDGLARTYDDGDSSTTDPSVYSDAYRLDLVPEGEGSGTSTQEPLLVPWPGGGTPNVAENAPLCYKCHDPDPFIVDDNPNTNLETNFDPNLHEYHLTIGNNQIYMADWSGSKNSQVTCMACHNVHGSTRLAMVRDGKLVSQTPDVSDECTAEDIPYDCCTGFETGTCGPFDYDGGGDGPEPGLQIWYKNDAISTYATNNTDPPSPENLPLAASDGTVWIGDSSDNLCTHCHGNANTTGEDRSPYQDASQAPTLDWTGEAGYVSDGVSPDTEASGATFTFRVKYTDVNNEAPSPINLLIDTNNDGNVDDTYAMTGADVGDVDYTNGRIYTKDLVLTDSVQYKFAASDGTDPATGSPTVWRAVSLLAGVINQAPELAWVSDTCRYQGVSPATGIDTGSGASFEFYVQYTDADDQFASLQVWVDLNNDGDYDDIDEKQDMIVDIGIGGGFDDGDYSNGENFTKTIPLSYPSYPPETPEEDKDGMLNYRFVASDGIEAATGDPTGTQSVTVIDSGLTPVTVCDSGCDATSIQAGALAALSGDHVTLVYEGTYPENLVLDNSGTDYSNSKVYSVCGPDATTISNSGNVVFLQNVSGIVIDGFGITGGTRGVNSNGGSATINNCKIHDNTNSTGTGGGLQSGNASGILTVVNSEIYSNTSIRGSAAAFSAGGAHTFTNTKIHDNEAIYDPGYLWSGIGGAVYASIGSVTFTDVTIEDNTSNRNGGAVYSNGSVLDFIRSTITGNTSTAGNGGAIALASGSEFAYLENCIVADNQAVDGGVFYSNGAAFLAVYSTFVGNQATAGDGGVLFQGGSGGTGEFQNSILWNNTASGEGHIAWSNGGSITITDTVIASGSDGIPNNAPYFVSNNDNVTPSVSGYVSESDPFFVDAENGDYHLKYFSPAIDQGTASGAPSVDIDGDTRPFDWVGLGDGVDEYDIGADEVTHQDESNVDSLSISNFTAIESGPVDAGESIVMSRIQVDCNDTGDSQCILESVTVEDIAFGLSGDWDNLEIYIDTDTDFTGATLIGQEASWDGSAVTVGLDQSTQADITVTYGTPKYVFIVYDITEAAEGKALQSRVTQVNVLFPDYGVTGLNYESNVVTVNGDSLSTSNNTAIQATGPGAGEANIVMQRFQADCGATGNNACILSDITVSDYGSAVTGDWDSLKIYIDTDTDFSGATLIGQAFFEGTSTVVTLDQGTVADRTVTNGTSKYIYIVYDINSGAEGETILSFVIGVGVESPDDGVALNYGSNLLTVQEAVGGDNLSTSNPAAVHVEYADQGEDGAVMERFQVDCNTADDGNCILSSITVDDLGTASSGDWDSLKIYIDTDTSFAGAVLIGQTSSWDGTSTIVSLSLGTEGDRTVTNGTSKYVFVVYDLNGSIAVDTTLQARVTAVGVSFPDTGVTGITYDSDVVTVKDAFYVGSGEPYTTIQAAVDAAANGDIIIVSEGTYVENVDHSPSSGTKVLHIYSANGPENTIIDGNDSGRVVTLGYRSSTSTLSGFTITNGLVAGTGGAGIYVNNAQPSIDNCIITGNDAGTLPGGGIHISHADSDVTITNTTISSNNGGNGGGLYMPSGTNATITNVVFDQNTGSLGGAIYFNANDNTTSITDSTFTGNSSTGDGGAFFIQGVNGITFTRCIITGNHSDTQGGVMRFSSDTTFVNCIIADNYAPSGGVLSNNGGDATFTNCTIANNTATGAFSSYGGGIMHACSGTLVMKNVIAWGNSATSGYGHNVYRTCSGPSYYNVGSVDYSDFNTVDKSTNSPSHMYRAEVTGGNNIDPATDPSFDVGGTYHLTSSSTNVIDAGTSSGAPSDDIDGDSRPAESGYDMGADEYYPPIVNETEAGTATAFNASDTIIDISMPYTGDDNGNNTYTVEYKLSSSGTWLDWGTNPKAHSASPYTDTITGLTTGETYDVRLTYNDADGVNGTNPQVVSGIEMVDNPTTVGTATAFKAGDTSIDVSMPYTGDENGDNTYTVEYKLSSSGTWLDWGSNPKAHSASPYTDTITGLTADETYDVRLTYNDADGVAGSAEQLFVVDMSMPGGVVAYWKFDETGGTTAYDSIGSNDGELQADASFVSGGKSGYALSLDGTDGYVEVPDDASLDTTEELTIELWFKPAVTYDATLTDFVVLLDRQWSTSTDSYFIGINSSGNLHLGTAGGKIQSTQASWEAGTWYHVVGTYRDVGGTYSGELYVNGVAQTLLRDNYDNMAGGSQNIGIGGADHYINFNGIIDEVVIYNSTLTPSEALDRYNSFPDNSTTVGTATAVQADDTSIDISMPYTVDTDGDNTYTVEYKLSSSGTWLDWGTNPKAHSASPYTDTITGLTTGETYDVRLTYNDADGVTGTNPQVVSAIELVDNATTVGTATAVKAGDTSIDVSMPYTGDGNGDNTYTVEYKLSSSGTWLDWGTNPKAHSASPYTDTITGLTTGETYDVRLTYNDADGVTGTNPQVVSGIEMVDNPTTAGTATAFKAGDTSIYISMPYTDDDNGDNTYTVEYKLSSSGTWLDWGSNPKAHSASPYTDTILGLTADETYDVRLTYNDADGVAGSAEQLFVVDLSMPPDAVAYWRFDETGGTTAYDSIGSNDGTLQADATFVSSGKSGYALSLDGTDDYVEMPDDASLDITEELTIELWFKPAVTYDAALTNLVVFLDRQWSTSTDSYFIGIHHTGKLHMGSAGGKIQSTQASWEAGTWYHVVGTYRDVGGTYSGELYVNGVAETLSRDSYDNMAGGSQNIGIGGADHYINFNGIIDEVVIYNRTLTPSEVLGRFNSYPDNATTVGSATAVQAGDTSIDISMPYTSDVDGDNSYTVEYKLSSSGTWLDWGSNPKAHSASPYIDTITGLTTGETYDVRLTYNDADGVTGTNPQVVSGIELVDSATFVGTATAVKASDTSIDISMPYTGDGNGDNTYTVEYKLSSSGTWLDWGSNPKAHSASPYIDTITGLTTGETYDVRLTYNDADGVTGTNPQVVSGIEMVDNPTTAGTATAVRAGDTSIDISMPYTGDDNGNNTYTVEYKLSSSGTWLDWGSNPKAHSASPYIDTIIGLTADETYDVRLTYNDADGVFGSAEQLFVVDLSIPPDAVAYWRFDETSGTTAYDSIGSNDGTLQADAAFVSSGKSGYALSLDGTDDYVEVPDDASLDITEELTIELWFKPAVTYDAALTNLVVFLDRQWSTSTDSYFIGIHSSGKLHMGSAGGKIQSTQASWEAGTWYHVVGTYRDVGGTYSGELYVNGLAETLPTDRYDNMAGGSQNIGIGGADHFINFNGIIDEVVIYNRTLTPSEVLDRYNSYPDNATTVGSATAVQAGDTSIGISMPYTSDVDGDNTYTVEYKLSSSGTWLDWGSNPKAHSASPYIDTITGLTTGETYDVRLTYNDADGVTGTNPQVVSGIELVDSATFVGTATAVKASDTSIDISMPYTDDGNGDNTYTVEYKLSSSGTWLDWGSNPKAHSASPYIDTITGLTTGETYDVRLTYNDADGVTGTNPQVVSGIELVDNPTTAGTATAVRAGDTSIDISMPYTDDDNGDNTYTVEYKLSSSGTWLDWGSNPKAHSASPYTDTITGLTADETYDVRLTYNDADGVVGSAEQLFVVDLSMPGGGVAYWRFDETSGTTAYDSIGSNDGELQVDATFVSGGKSGYALSLDGTDDYVEMPDDASLDITEELTIELWFKPAVTYDAALTNLVVLLDRQWSTSTDSYFLGIHKSGKLHMGSAGGKIQSTQASWEAGTWYHVVGTYRDVGGTYSGELYVNGVAETLPTDSYDNMAGGSQNIGIGGADHWINFNGIIDEVVIYNRTLTPSEVLDRYNSF